MNSEINGHYYLLEYRTKKEAHTFRLDIFKEDKQQKFKLQQTVSGHFGSVGNEWEGNCIERNGSYFLISEIWNDWRSTFLDEERQEKIFKDEREFKFEILTKNSDVALILHLETKRLILYKLKPKFERISPAFIDKIIKDENLEEMITQNEIGSFWRFSNLILRSPEEKDNGSFSIICEYDLEKVKEEKRVIQGDEVSGEQKIAQIECSKDMKLINYEYIQGQ